ncbi:MAG: glycoside hydrolase family 3 C-terminal domain-containing protein, partial [Bifidobacteriaceae bacterium]|nr:glycoside hydrolase family 3 C-terminal domain-containing protein [Bifidobacteriaceae bacterium]
AGFDVNPTLWDFYATGEAASYRKTTPDVYGQGEYAVNEVPLAVYTDAVIDSFAAYADAAVVVIGRSGGETGDLPAVPGASGVTYLQLTADERDMIELACEHFGTVVVVLNTQNPLEGGFLEEYAIDAALWAGAFGQIGATAVGEVLAGQVNPSGALVDTYAYDSTSAPAMANFGSYQITNVEVGTPEIPMGGSYIAYSEGIYVGYRYYETRYEDVVTGRDGVGAFDYAAEVQFPFGHGLSYTDFEWGEADLSESDEAYEVAITVTNTGAVAGKDIVQVYLQSPYTDYDREHGIEKAAVELAGYAKTGLLEPGAKETVTVSVPKELLKTYDADGEGTYVLDAGDYYLAAGQDAHAAVNNILAAKGFSESDGMDDAAAPALAHKVTVADFDAETYAVSPVTGNEIANQFTDVDLKTWDADFVYLSRSDWTGTWPGVYADGAWAAPEEFVKALELTVPEDPDAEVPEYGVTSEEFGELNAAMMRDLEYDNPAWEALLDQASLDDLEQLVRIGGYATRRVDSIQLPATTDTDGPQGFSAGLVGGSPGFGYSPAIVLASSWNDSLAEDMGKAIGEESLQLGTTGWYAPAMNIHRTPYSGRNFEYYSEDGLLSGKMSAAIIRGAQDKGVIVFAKHFAVNDQETNRMAGSMLASEQAVREIYLKPFELSVREGGALGMMAAMNRIGPLWVGAHPGLMTGTLRGEWGFTGVVITDQASFSVFSYEDMRMGLAAGTDLWLNTDAELWKLSDADMTATVQANIRRAAHNTAYAVVHSNAMNGLSPGARIEAVTPPWRWWLITANVVLGALALAGLAWTTTKLIRQRRGRAEAAA